MAAARRSDTTSLRQPLVAVPESESPHSQPPQYVVVLPPNLPPYRHRLLRGSCLRCGICSAVVVVLLLVGVYLLWPSDPELQIVRVGLDRIHFHTRPQISLDITLDLTVRVRNKDFYSLDYESLLVAIEYRDRRLGNMSSDGGYIKPRGSSYVNATLEVDGVEMLHDVILFLDDLAKGSISFDTVSEISGKLSLLFIALPIKTKISCEVIVDTHNQTIAHQNCYPEV
ncbi:uncharacterized protein LOC127266164 [Andrographis paniculata]|uniref:uncharacterized protein LOC127266164 n=1 Tax=Andrographis paniculata TaxID=175694 RepID=UPI0021E78881|nr:uncharacterized protein LOC127266164 [Andrographis paniculata]